MVGASGCSTAKSTPVVRAPLPATACKPESVSQYNQEGMSLFKTKNYEAAKEKFAAAVAEGPKCAEPHYNLGLVLSNLGAKDDAREQFLEAANLAPGNQIIWDSPALHRYGDPQKEKKEKDKDTKTASERAPGAFSNRGRVGGY